MWSDPILTSKWMNKKLYGKLLKYTQLFFLQATRFGNSALKTSLPRRCSYGFVMHSCQQMSAELKDKFLSHCSKKYQLAITCRLLEKRVTSYVCFVRCLWLFIFESTIFGTRRRDNWPIKLRKQRDVILLQVPAPAWKNGRQTGEKLPKAEKAFKGWDQESYRNTEQDIIALPPGPNITSWNPSRPRTFLKLSLQKTMPRWPSAR